MITIEKINGEPARQLTAAELRTVKNVLSNATHFIYYQGDEVCEECNRTPQPPPAWLEMKKDLLRSGAILNTMMTAAAGSGLMGARFNLLFEVLNMGIDGEPDEQAVETLLSVAGWGFSSAQKDTINQYFNRNNFNISI
jgi:hypothetical protein